MSLHHDFPYAAARLYCKTCKKETLHTQNYWNYTCDECGRVWDDLLLRVNVRQDQYGKIHYDCILASEKTVNSTEYPAVTVESLDECIQWMRSKATDIQEAVGKN